MEIKRLKSVDSTNTWLSEHASEIATDTIVTAGQQTAGRGQRGNSWESMPGKNLTFSMLHKPFDFPARCQFSISEAVALSVADSLSDFKIDAKVKWPNDIYVGDKKICGILIEHAVMGTSIMYSIIGVGLNVNQEKFFSDAPNPVSMCNIRNEDFNIEDVLASIAQHLEQRLRGVETESGRATTHEEFKGRLWRGEGRWRWRDMKSGKDEIFMAEIADIDEQGFLQLRDSAGVIHQYAFKEVAAVID